MNNYIKIADGMRVELTTKDAHEHFAGWGCWCEYYTIYDKDGNEKAAVDEEHGTVITDHLTIFSEDNTAAHCHLREVREDCLVVYVLDEEKIMPYGKHFGITGWKQ